MEREKRDSIFLESSNTSFLKNEIVFNFIKITMDEFCMFDLNPSQSSSPSVMFRVNVRTNLIYYCMILRRETVECWILVNVGY